MIVHRTLPEEANRVNELFAIAFEMPLSNCPADPGNPKVRHWAAFGDSGEMMSTLTVNDYQIRFDGNACRMGGVGGVATLPQYRRRGGIRACFEKALRELHGEGFDFSYLYPFSTAYYRKFGYECCVQKLSWQVDLSLLNSSKADGTLRLAEPGNDLAEAIQTLDSLWEARYNMMVLHSWEDYDWVAKANPAVKQEYTYVYSAPDGTPKGYTTFRTVAEPDGRNLVCSRFCFADREGFAGLMSLFKSMASDHRFLKFQTPFEPSLQYLLPEWSLGAAKWSVLANSGMVRVVNVEEVLKKARYSGSGTLTLKIRDRIIPENDGTFTLEFRDGQAVSMERTEAEPDIDLTIGTFSALIVGVSDFSGAAEWMDGLIIHNPDAPFAQVFYRKPLMIVDYF